ncbi:MAG: hypothetical protein RR610_21310, partial [Citrobacter sp.]
SGEKPTSIDGAAEADPAMMSSKKAGLFMVTFLSKYSMRLGFLRVSLSFDEEPLDNTLNVCFWHIAALKTIARRHGVSGVGVQILSCRLKNPVRTSLLRLFFYACFLNGEASGNYWGETPL